jgi:hypothetical protein
MVSDKIYDQDLLRVDDKICDEVNDQYLLYDE